MKATMASLLGALVAGASDPHPAPTNPFCGQTTMRNVVSLSLTCVNGVIDSLPFAAFGTPTGSCPNFEHSSTCDDPTFWAYANATCIGQPNCTLVSQGADPCSGVVKSIYAVAHCSEGPGGYAPYPPLPSPTCALNGVPCPPPTWVPTWNLTESTVIQPSSNGYFMPSHPWGLISLDWSVANSIWYTGNKSNTTCEATSRTGCALLKTAGLANKCFIYHNMELALEWLESQRAVMYDPTYAGFFLQYTDGLGNKNGTIYNEGINFGDQFFWDFTNASAAQYFISSVLSSISDPSVDGTFTDDVEGVPEEHPNVQANINLTDAQLASLQYATQATSNALIESLVIAGKYNWQAFGAEDGTQGGANKDNCVSWMQTMCDPATQGRSMMLSFDSSNVNQSIASFLVTRPPYAWIGFGWESDDRNWNDIFYLQTGEPTGLCSEGPAGVFSRPWTQGIASIDCNSWTASLPFPSL